MKIHRLKTVNPHFQDLKSGKKKYEVRKNDRDFKIGDLLSLDEFIPEKGYTGYTEWREIIHILVGGQYGIDPEYCVLGLKKHK